MKLVVRRYGPSDEDRVQRLFSTCTREHIRPCFQNAMASPLYITITLSLCFAGYLFSSLFAAVLLPAAWAGLVYYCCHAIYDGYVTERLQTDMQDIVGNFLSRPDDCFWVAEAEVDGKVQIIGMVAVVCKQSGKDKHGELFRMMISPQCRRMGLAYKMTHIVIDFCRKRGFSKVELETSSTQMAAVALYKKLGFEHVLSHRETHVSFWVVLLAQMTVFKMEKEL